MSNPFDALDKPAAPAAGNPFDAFDNADDTAAREKVESDPSFRAIVSQFARNRLDGISAAAQKLPTLDSVSTLEERDRAKFVRGELDAATAAHEEASRSYRDIQSRGDRDNLGRASEAMDAASRRLAFARELDQDVAGKVIRTATPQQLMLIDKTITEQIRRVDYYESLIEQGDGGDDVKRNLEREKAELIKLEAAREHARQRVADPNRPLDPSAVADVVGGIGQGMGSTFPSLMGAAGERIGQDAGNVGLTEIGRILREYGEGNRRDTVPAPKFSDLSIGKEGFGRDVRRFLATSLGEGVGTSLPIIATYMAGGAPAAFGGSALLGIGQMQSALTEAFAQEGLELPPDKAAWYVYTYGTAIGMLESLTEVWGLRALTGEAKKRAAKSIAAAMAAGAAKGAVMEGLTEGLQEIVEIAGVSNATGKPIDWDEARRRLVDATAAGAVPGSVFGTVSATGQRKHAFDLALEKAKELGFDVQPQTPAALPGGAPEITPPQGEPPQAPAEAAQTLPEPQPATAGPEGAAAPDLQPSTLPPELEPMADAIDAILPDGVGVDRQIFDKPVGDIVAETVAAVTGEPMAQDAALEAQVPAAPLAPDVQAQAEQIAAQPAPEQFLRQHIAEGGSLSRSALPDLARRMAVTEQQLAQVMDEAVKRGELRKTAGGMYRRAASAPAQSAPSMFKLADSHRQANDALDEALNFGRQILPRGVQVGVRPGRIFDSRTGLEIDGQFDPSAGRIVLSAYAMQPKGVLAHEGLHVLVKQGQMTLDEVVILANHARKTGAFTPEIEQAYRQAYAGRANVNLAIDEEAAAHLIAARVNGADFGKQINAIIDRILQVLERIANALKGRGFKSVDDVVNALVTGEMAQREPSAPEQVRQFMAQEDLTAMAVRPDAVMFAFAGERARTADLKALARARRMTETGADRTQVWNETGWFQGVDGKWRYEIDDSLAEYLGGVKRARRFDRAIDHPELAAAYPDLGAAPVRGVKPTEELMGMVASYNPLTKEFALRNAPEFDAKTKSSGLHEAQHFIQGKEGFAQGANEILARGHLNDQSAADQIAAHEAAIADKPTGLRYFSQTAWQEYYKRLADTMTERLKVRREAAETPRSRREVIETYRRFAGEVESRLVQKRMDMTADERRARPPWLDYDVPEDQQIVRMSDDVMFSLVDASTGQSMRRDLDALGYYSQALEAAKAWPQSKGTTEQAITWLKKSGVKDAEIEATGLKGFLEGKKSVSKAEIATFFDQNRVRLTAAVYQGAEQKSRGLQFVSETDLGDGITRNEFRHGRTGDVFFADDNGSRVVVRDSLGKEVATAEDMGEAEETIVELINKSGGRAGPAKWSSYSLDPSNPTYRETVLHLPKNEGFQTFEAYRASLPPAEQRYPEANIRAEFEATRPLDNFQSGHFSEPNIIGHMMTSMVKHEGKPVYLIDQIQSDWGQKLRDGGVRDEAKIAELKARRDEAARKAEAVRAAISGSVGKDASNIVSIHSDLLKSWGAYPYDGLNFARDPSRIAAVIDQINMNHSRSPQELRDAVSNLWEAKKLAAAQWKEISEPIQLLDAEIKTLEASSPGNPLVNTTDQWVNTTLRRAIRQAAEADAQYIAIPSGKTVLSYNPGDEAGMEGFYNGIVPKNLRNLLRKIDKASPDPIRTDKLDTPTAGMKGEGFTIFPLTDTVKQSVMSEGQPMFALRSPRRLTIDGNRMSRRQVENDIRMWLDSAEGVRRRASEQDLTPEQKAEAESYVRQYERWAEDLRAQLPRFDQEKFPRGRPFKPAKVIDAGERFVVRRLGGLAAEEETSRTYRIYAKPTDGKQVNLRGSLGEVSMSQHPDGRWEVDMVEVGEKHRGKGVAKALYNAVEGDIGGPMRPSGILLPDGYAMWKARNPELVKYHTLYEDQYYLSPKRMLAWRSDVIENNEMRKWRKKELDDGLREERWPDEKKTLEEDIAYAERRALNLTKAISSLPIEAIEPEVLNNMFALNLGSLFRRDQPLSGLNTIIRDLAHDVVLPIRQGLLTDAAKKAKKGAKQAGSDLTSYYDPQTGVLRVTRMSDLSAVLGAVGEALIRRFDKMDQWMKGPGKFTNPLENLIINNSLGLLGQSGKSFLWSMMPAYSGQQLVPVLRDALADYLHAWNNYTITRANARMDPSAAKAAERALTNAQRQVARYGNRNLDAAINAEHQAFGQSQLPLVAISRQDFADYVDIRYNPSSKIVPPVVTAPTDPAEQRAAFAQWFRGYMLDPASTRMQDPAFFDAFEDLIDREDPTLSAKLDDSQAAIAAHAKAQPVQIIQAMIKSPERVTQMQEWFRQMDRDGLLPTLADWARTLYRGGWDKLHPFYTAVRTLLELHQLNTGKRLDLKAAENAYKLLRLAPHSHAIAGRDLEDGIKNRLTNKPEGPSLVEALKTALGTDRASALDMSPDGPYQKFTAYLIARRAIRLWERFDSGELERPPLGASKDTARATIQTLEAANPEFMAAAEEVYEFQRNLLKLQRDAHLITPELYEQLVKDADYVPFLRDMTDKPGTPKRALSKGAQSIIKKFKGSDRDILDPIAMIAQKVYETRQLIGINDAKLMLLQLAESAGPGSGMIAERLDDQQSKAMRVDLKNALRSLANEIGVSNADATALVHLAQQLLGDDMMATVFTKGQMKAGAEPVTWVYEKGVPVPMRLADGDLGRLMYETLENLGREHTHLVFQLMILPTQLVRGTITSNPAFILRNMFVDGLMAWMYEKTATPWLTQVGGFANAIRQTPEITEYARNAGLMGGVSTTSLDKLRLDRDVNALIAQGYKPKLWESPGAWMSELARNPLRKMFEASEASETGTRARLYKIAFDRSKANGLNDVEAAAEAAFFAHDYMDYSRSGSVVGPIARVVAFMNAAMQGMDRYFRLLTAKGDYGSAWKAYMDFRMGKGPALTERENAELAQSAQAWFVSMAVMGSMSLIITALFGDDERMKEIPEELRSTHWIIPLDGVLNLVPKEMPGLREFLKPLDGQMLRLPKAFETAWFANLIERVVLEAARGNPRWWENYMRDLKSTLNPPMEPQALQLIYELKTGKSMFSGRDIVPTWKQERLREGQWDEYTSEFSKWLGKKTDTSPYYIDHTLKGLGTSWARDMLSLNVPGLPWYRENKPEKSLDEVIIARRFLWKAGKGADSSQKVREIMGAEDPVRGVWDRLSTPYSKLDASAETYKEYLKRRDPASASELLDRLKPAERGYAVMDANLEGDASKYKMVHPMHRADRVLREISGLQKEILGDLVESKKKVGKKGELIPLGPSEKRAALDALTQYQMMEAHNALVLTGEIGWDKRGYFDSSAVLAELKASVPSVGEEFERRMKKANVLPFAQVQQVWPKLKETIEAPEFAALSKADEKREIRSRIRSLYGEAR